MKLPNIKYGFLFKGLLSIVSLLCYLNSYAQEPTDSLSENINISETDTLISEKAIPPNDTLLVLNDSTFITSTDTGQVEKGYLASRAFMFSAIVPGGGQVYNKQYWKVPIFAGATATGIVFSIRTRKNFVQWRDAYQFRLENPDSPNDLYPDLTSPELFETQLRAKRKFNLALFGTSMAYGFNLLDAFASANIRNSDLSHPSAKAAYYSAMIPGLGQAYNKKYWKIPFVYAGLAAGGYFIYDTNRKYNAFTSSYINRDNPDFIHSPSVLRLASVSDASSLLAWRERFHTWLELSVILTAAWYIVNILDATVDGHLFNFDEEIRENLTFRINPYLVPINAQTNAFGMHLSVQF